MFHWLQHSSVATTIGQSQLLTGLASGIHLIGMTLVLGGVIVTSLRLFGVVLAGYPVADVTSTARRGISAGLAVSIVSGVLLFLPKAVAAAGNGLFQLKMLLLAAAALFQFAIYRRALVPQHELEAMPPKLAGALAIALWGGVALAACAFIFLE